MKNIITAVVFSIVVQTGFAQWNTSGTHIYNSNSGNVGIGTSDFTYNYKLNVAGVIATQGIRIPNRYGFGQSESAIEFEIPTSSYNAIRGYNGTQHIGTIHFFDDTWPYQQSAGAINLSPLTAVTIGNWTAPVAYFRSSDGFVGVGTSAPADQLEIVSGNRKVGFNTAISGISNGGVLSLSRGDDGAKIMYFGASESPNDDPVIYGNGGGVEMRLVSGGGSSSGFGFYTNMTHQIAFASARPAPLVKIDGSGKVGIGTSAPGTKLEVNGDLTLASVSGNKQIFTWSANDLNWRIGMSVNPGFTKSLATSHSQYVTYYSGAGQGFALGVNGGESSFEVRGSDHTAFFRGNVGIGTANPTQKLTVNGTIYGKEVKVDLNVPGPDYVFEKDYKLPSLDEIKSYINQHKHLPEVPSAKEMEQNGINLSEMNMILLKKVEELTLHLLQQKEEISQLHSEIKELKNKN
jgi:hypothetical protein